MILNENPFINDPFAIIYRAYKNLYDKPVKVYYKENPGEKWGSSTGVTLFPDGEPPRVYVFWENSIMECMETLCHELAHVAVGKEHEHDDCWEEACQRIFDEYNRIGQELRLET